MFQGSNANAFRFGSQLYDVRFGSSCCTSIHTSLFVFSVLLYVWALGLKLQVYNGISRVQHEVTLGQTRKIGIDFIIYQLCCRVVAVSAVGQWRKLCNTVTTSTSQ